jgi:hypothetical protein
MLLRGEIPPINASQARAAATGLEQQVADDPVSTGADSPAKGITASAQTPNRRERSSRRRADAVEWGHASNGSGMSARIGSKSAKDRSRYAP